MTHTQTHISENRQGHASLPTIVKVKCRRSLANHANEMQMRGTLGRGNSFHVDVVMAFTPVRFNGGMSLAASDGLVQGCERGHERGADGWVVQMKEWETVYLRVKDGERTGNCIRPVMQNTES